MSVSPWSLARSSRWSVCRNDVCLENVVFRDGRAVALLDFDVAAPGRRVFDVASFARMCDPIDDNTSASRLGWSKPDRPSRLRVVADAYGLDSEFRVDLLTILDRSIERGGEFVRRRVEAGDPGFVKMWAEMGGVERFDRRRRWWADERANFGTALRWLHERDQPAASRTHSHIRGRAHRTQAG